MVVEAVDVDQRHGDVDGQLICGCPDGGREQHFGGHLRAGETAPPGLRARVAHHDVGPGHVQPGKRGVRDDGEERTDEGRGEAPDEEVVEEGVDQVVHDRDLEAAEPRPWTGLSAKVLHGAADLRGDGLGLDEEEFGLEFLDLLLVSGEERCIAFARSGRWLESESCCRRTFDGSKSGYDGPEGVADLACC